MEKVIKSIVSVLSIILAFPFILFASIVIGFAFAFMFIYDTIGEMF